MASTYSETAYKNMYAIIFYYEDDTTNAERDANSLHDCLYDIFNMTVFKLKLGREDQTPDLTLKSTIDHVLNKINPYGNRKGERSLLILSYIGATICNSESGLRDMRSETGKQIIQWEGIKRHLFTDMPALDNIDTLGLIDGSVLPKITERTTMRTCQVITGCDLKGDPFTLRFVQAAKQL